MKIITPIAYHLLAFALIFWLFALPWAQYPLTLGLFGVPGTALLMGVAGYMNWDTLAGVKIGLCAGFLLDIFILNAFSVFSPVNAISAAGIIWLMSAVVGELSESKLRAIATAIDVVKEKYR